MDFVTYFETLKSVSIGKKLVGAIYVHYDALTELPVPLQSMVRRVAEAFAIGADGFNIVKLSTTEYRLSYLLYPDFESSPYPALQHSHTVDLETEAHRYTSYADAGNPPILHHRELFLSVDDPRRQVFKVFTEEGERIGAYKNTRGIGTLKGWENTLRRLGYRIAVSGHLEKLTLSKVEASAPSETERVIARHKTALTRKQLSVPMFALASLGFLDGRYSVLDYGCGRGDDVRELSAAGIDCVGWDPIFLADEDPKQADIVNLGYVINVIENSDERADTIRQAYKLSKCLLVISAMLEMNRIIARFTPYKDGVVTRGNVPEVLLSV